jgi:hypothetical protein
MPPGTFGFWEAGMKHFAWVEGETILQLHGMGPWEVKYLNPADDPRNAKKDSRNAKKQWGRTLTGRASEDVSIHRRLSRRCLACASG